MKSENFRPENGAFFDLSDRAKLRLSGADGLRFLNGQISNDLRKATSQESIHACVLNAKGKIDADICIAAEADDFLIDAAPELRERLAARLERYVIADDVAIGDVTDDFALFHVIGEMDETFSPRSANRFGCAGFDLWLDPAEREVMRQKLAARFPFCDAECAEILRIENGIPRWDRELTNEIIPTEANLETNAIDYAKGCYIGQEVISRIKMSGQTNKRLCGFVSVEETPLRAGLRLTTRGADAKEIGWLTSAATSARLGKAIALGFVKRGFQAPGTRFEARAQTAAAAPAIVEIVPLPFASLAG